MAFREVDVIEVREVLRWWLDGVGLRTIAEQIKAPLIPCLHAVLPLQ